MAVPRGGLCGVTSPLSLLCVLLLFSVACARECCLLRDGGTISCNDGQYCCDTSFLLSRGATFQCCQSPWRRANSIYVDKNCNVFPVWGIVLIVLGLFFAIACGVAMCCCCKKSKGFAGRVENISPITYPGASAPVPPPAYSSESGATPAWSMAPPPYSQVVAEDNANK